MNLIPSNTIPELSTVRDRYLEIRVSDDSSYREASEILIAIKALRKQIADTFDPAIKAANDAHKKILGQKKKSEEMLVSAETHLKGEISRYATEIEAKNKEARDASVAQGELVLPMAVAVPHSDAITTKLHWTFEVIDFHALLIGVISGVVPEEAVMTNDSFIRKEILKKTTTLGYPGIRPYQERIVAVSTKE